MKKLLIAAYLLLSVPVFGYSAVHTNACSSDPIGNYCRAANGAIAAAFAPFYVSWVMFERLLLDRSERKPC